MRPSDFVVTMRDMDHAYAAPERILDDAEEAWRRAADGHGLHLRAYKSGKGQYDGLPAVAWCVDESEDMYLVLYSPSERNVFAVYYQKAKRQTDKEK